MGCIGVGICLERLDSMSVKNYLNTLVTFQKEIFGPPEVTYHGIISEHDLRKVIIKEGEEERGTLKSLDNSCDYNWGYSGRGPLRLAGALAAHAFGDKNYATAFDWKLRDGLVSSLDREKPFIVSRDRIVLEVLLAFNELVYRSERPRGGFFIDEIEELIEKKHEVRERMISLLSGNSLQNLINSKYGLKRKRVSEE